MAERRRSSKTESRASQMLRSVHEGWAHHFTPQSRAWIKRWLVLDGSRLVVFSADRTSSQAVIVSLNLGQGTKIRDVSLQPHVIGLDIELTTMKSAKESRTDFFGFSTPNECDLWKAYILGFSTGFVPENLNLLPGQLKDVREAILDLGPAPPPPPLPNPKRPTLRNLPGIVMHERPSVTGNFPSTAPPSQGSPGNVTSPYSDINESNSGGHSSNSAGIGGAFDNGAEGDVLQQLERRRAELAMKALEKEVDREPAKLGHHGMPVVSPSAQMPGQQPWSQPQPSSKNAARNMTQRIVAQKSRTPMVFNNNNELPPFYDDQERNKVPPPWFINCSREVAEMILTAARNHGNMFMRPSFNVNPSETYVISMRRDLPGGLELRHYAVYRTVDGFKLDVIDKHNAMSCLSVVMDFFKNYVGPSAQPLSCQEVERILGGVTSPGSIFSPKPLTQPNEQVFRRSDSAIFNELKSGENIITPSETEGGNQSLTETESQLENLQNLHISRVYVNTVKEIVPAAKTTLKSVPSAVSSEAPSSTEQRPDMGISSTSTC